MNDDVGEIARKKLKNFMTTEWNESESKYFETTEPYVTLNKYAEKLISRDIKEKEKYQKKYDELLFTLSEEEKAAKRNYDMKVFTKKTLEFFVNNDENLQDINEFMQQLSVSLVKIRKQNFKQE